ncbi:MAG: site-specific integrase [Chloroflexota bacterium]
MNLEHNQLSKIEEDALKGFQLATESDLAAVLELSHLADRVSGFGAFAEYQNRKSASTRNAQKSDLAKFASFINSVYEKTANSTEIKTIQLRLSEFQLYEDPRAWSVMSHGLIKLYRNYLTSEGYALTSINRSLSTIRKYAVLAAQAGFVDTLKLAEIKNVSGYRHSEMNKVDENRSVTRVGSKKEEAVPIPQHVVVELKNSLNYPDTPAGRRDRLAMCIFLDHGLRASEVAALKIDDIDLSTGIMIVRRKKTSSVDLIYMTADTYNAMEVYFEMDALPHSEAPLLRTSRKSGELSEKPLTRITVSRLVNKYGKKMSRAYPQLGLEKLSAHDGRHQWATDALEAGTPLNALQQAGGWKSPAMPLRYANKAKIANKGVKLNR